MMCCDQDFLEHPVPQGTARAGEGSFHSKSSAVACDRCQSSERSSLFAADCADLGHFSDQHGAGNWTDPRDGSKDDGHLGQALVARDGPVDPVFHFLDHAGGSFLQFAVHVLEHRSGPNLLLRTGLSEKSFAHFDQLAPFRRQRSEKTQLFRRKTAARFRSECEEAGDDFCINPVCLGSAQRPSPELGAPIWLQRLQLIKVLTAVIPDRPLIQSKLRHLCPAQEPLLQRH